MFDIYFWIKDNNAWLILYALDLSYAYDGRQTLLKESEFYRLQNLQCL